MILYSCPTCGAKLEAEEHCTGQKHACPQCQQRLQVPPPPPSRNKTVLGKSLDKDNKTLLGKPLAEPVVLEVADEDDDYRMSRRSQRYAPFACPYCGSQDVEFKKSLSGIALLLFLVLLLVFCPLWWAGICLRETWEVCGGCSRRVRQESWLSFDWRLFWRIQLYQTLFGIIVVVIVVAFCMGLR